MKPKIILYHPKSNPGGKCILPMSLLALGAALEGIYEYTILDANAEHDPLGALDELIDTHGYNLLAVTVMPGPQLVEAVVQTREMKRRHPHLPTLWGGYFPTLHSDTALRADYVDYIIRGQGEITLREFLHALEHAENFDAVAGLSFKRNGVIKHNRPRDLTSPEAFPLYPYQRVTMSRYLNRNYMGNRVTEHHSSFGCPFGCNFCAVVPMVNHHWLPESPARLEKIFRLLRDEHGVDAVNFHDMDFFVSSPRVLEFAERIRPLDMHWWALGRVDELHRLTDAQWRTLRASGLKMVFSGAESGSDEILKRMNKGGQVSPRMTIELARRLKEFDIVPEFSFVMGNPPDPVADIRTTIQFIREIKRVNPATEIILYMYTPVPLDGTLYHVAQDYGFKFPETLDEWVNEPWRTFSLRRNPGVPWLDKHIQKMVREFEAVLNAYYPTVTDAKLRGLRREFSRALSAWRYRSEFYTAPFELKAWQKLVHYQRPETTGF